jgi:hypothetical protein
MSFHFDNQQVINQFDIDTRRFDIIASEHCIERMAQRKIDQLRVVGSIHLLGEKVIMEHIGGDEVMIINEDFGFSVVCSIKEDSVVIITVINKSNVFVQKGTSVVRLQERNE